MKYTVILMYPDYLSENGPGETWCGSVKARDPVDAVRQAQREAECEGLNDLNDFLPVSVFQGDREDLVSQWAEADPREKDGNAERCNGYRCKELILPNEEHYGTPCGTYCPDCLARHMKSCNICRSQFA